MIIDSLENSALYEHLNPFFPKAFAYLKSLDFSKLEAGKIELEGKDLFVGISETNLKEKKDAKLEAHNNYIDIQVPVSKKEIFGWKPRQDIQTEAGPFNTEKDVQFYEDTPVTYFDLNPKNFTILFPHDTHAPCIGEGSIFKIVIKVKVKS